MELGRRLREAPVPGGRLESPQRIEGQGIKSHEKFS